MLSHVDRRGSAAAFRRRLGVVAAAGLTVALSLAGFDGHAAAAVAPAITLAAPAVAHVGDVVSVRVGLSQPTDVAAFEVPVSADSSAATVEAGDTRAPGNEGRQAMTMIDATGGVLAAYTSAGGAHSATDVLGTLFVRLTAPGRVELRTGSVVLADATGNRLAVAGGAATATIDVVDANGTSTAAAHPAPASAWTLSDAGAGRGAWRTIADARVEWQTSRLAGTPCAGSSAGASGGCIDIADVQHMTAAAAVQPAAGPNAASATTAGSVAALAPNVTYTVTGTGDTPGSCSGGSCTTLRAAITAANTDGASNTINFNISGPGVHTIQLNSQLPVLTEGSVTIDGYSQNGASPNTNPAPGPDNAVIRIEVRGGGSTAFDSFVVSSPGNTIKGLAIYDTRRPIWIDGPTSDGNTVQGNFIGTNAAGTFASTVGDPNGHGIHIQQDANDTLVGGTAPAARNVISGNSRTGVGMWDIGSDNTLIYGNIIGLNPAGTGALPNMMHGVDFNFGVSGSRLGGNSAGQINVISGNTSPTNEGSGVEISHTIDTVDNQVVGNYIGTDLTGNAVHSYTANGNTGVYIEDGASSNLVQNNVIANNLKGGVRILLGLSGARTTGNVVRGNRIGLTANGTAAGNGQLGVSVDGYSNVVDSNIIANNGGAGILSGLLVTDSHGNTFTKNTIFDNVGLNIDLVVNGKRGITLNDPGDADSGPNTLLNFPVITSATTTGAAGTACNNCTVELFLTGANPSANNVGPLRQYVTSTVANGQGVWSVSYAAVPLVGALSSTATDANGNTSEASENLALVQGSGGAPPPPPPPPAAGTNYVTMSPARFLETRTGDPAFTTFDGQFQGIGLRENGTTTVLQVTGRDGVPDNAAAVALNITVTGSAIPGFLTVYPCGQPQPTASNLNYAAGATIPNMVISKVGTGGTVCIFNSAAVHIIADLNGYFPPASYNTMVPARLLETRTGDPAFTTIDGQFQGIGIRPNGTVTQLQVTGRDGIPANAEAVVLNVTATGAAIPGYVTVFPCGSPMPTASNLNYVGGSTIPNLVMSQIGTGGAVCIFNSAATHLVADVDGYFPQGSTFTTMVPARVLETRTGNPLYTTVDGQFQGIGIRGQGAVTELQVTGRAGVPVGASAVVLNVTATEAAIPGFITVFPCGTDQPTASNLNYVAGSTIPNLVIAQVGLGGKVCLFNSAPTHLIADLEGYFPGG